MPKSISLNGLWHADVPGCPTGLEMTVPGCWENITERKDISGPVRIYRVFSVPAGSDMLTLRFSGVSYYCDIFVNGRLLGNHEGIWDSFSFDVTEAADPDGDNLLELLVWKPGYHETDRFPLRQVLSGFIPDVCCSFGGIWDDVTLEMSGKAFISGLYAEGSPVGAAEVHAKLVNRGSEPFHAACRFLISDGKTSVIHAASVTLEPKSENWHVFAMKASSPRAWSPGDPFLYDCRLEMGDTGILDTAECRFGFRSIRTEGTRILLNDNPVYLRGVLHWGYYDDLISPNPSPGVIGEEIRKIRDYGFNMVKHCLYIPREAYLRAADEAGLLTWVELPLWLPEATPRMAERIMREYPRIIEALAGHPSVVLLSLGCELDDSVGSADLEKMYHMAKSMSSALVRDNSGSGECYGGLTVDFADYSDYHFYADLHNMENLMETFTPGWRNFRPWLFGEFCDSDTLRSLPFVRRQIGVQQLWWESGSGETNPISKLKPDFRLDVLDARSEKCGITADFPLMEQLSVNHAMTHRKMTMELTRSFPEIGGYVITSLRDVPIATSGMLDDALAPKYDMDSFRQFNEDLVLVPAWDLARQWINGDRVLNGERFNYFSGSRYGLHILASNYSEADLANPSVCWKLCPDSRNAAASGDIADGFAIGDGQCIGDGLAMNDSHVIADSLADGILTGETGAMPDAVCRGGVQELCRINLTLPIVDEASAFILSVEMKSGTTIIANKWPVFVYPNPSFPEGIAFYDPINILSTVLMRSGARELADGENPGTCGLVVTTRLTPEILLWAEQGGQVFHMQRGNGRLPVKKVAFWREGMMRTFAHPVVRNLGQAWMDDLRYFSLSTDTAFDTDAYEGMGIGRAIPVIRRYDCRENTASDYLVEIPWGKGRIMATTLRFEGGMGKQPAGFENNCLALHLFGRIAGYLSAK